MDEREMLELAAKAAGLVIDKSPYNGGGAGNDGFDMLGNVVLDWHNDITWNPLIDSGQAFELAVKLHIHVEPDELFAWASTRSADAIEHYKYSDPCAATRRAVVRVAAAIGKSLEQQTEGEKG